MSTHLSHALQPMQRLPLALPHSDGTLSSKRRHTPRPMLPRTSLHSREAGRSMGNARFSSYRTGLCAVRIDRHLRLHRRSVLARHKTLHSEPPTYGRVFLRFSPLALRCEGSEVGVEGA